jgi:hypothetical protein
MAAEQEKRQCEGTRRTGGGPAMQDYGSGGWGFESLAARTISPGQTAWGYLLCLPPDHPLDHPRPHGRVIKQPPGDQEAGQPLVGRRLRRPRPTHRPQAPEDRHRRDQGRGPPARSPPHQPGQHRAARRRRRQDRGRPHRGLVPVAPLGAPDLAQHPGQLPALRRPEVAAGPRPPPLNRVDTATIDRFYAELRQRGSKCQHCYRRLRDGQPPMRPGEVFQLRFSGEERVHQTDCVQGIPMTPSAIRDVHAVLSGALSRPWSGAGSATTRSR